MPNVELLERTMQQIVDHPESHDQTDWIGENECGTAACFAGWAALLSGWKVSNVYAPPGYVTKGGRVKHAAAAAIEELSITEEEAERLFASHNTKDDLHLMVKDLVNGDQLRPSRPLYRRTFR